jgi:hypothetical protein
MRLQRAVETLAEFNSYSDEHFKMIGPKFAAKGKQLHAMKKDLDVIFGRIRLVSS